jgi:cytosine/adenosine deaminase-related metal-dependent hydrolase
VTTSRTWSVSAEWVLPADGRTIRRGVLRGRGAAIEAVGPLTEVLPAPTHRELGEVALLPGLVNAHTHLELTHLRGQIPARRPISQWLYALNTRWPAAHEADGAVEDGAAEALATGTTALADTCHSNRAWRVLKSTPLRKICFAEVSGVGRSAGAALVRFRKSLRGIRPSQRLRFGVSPHAPYSTSAEVYQQAVALARKRNWPVSTHLAEAESERQFLLRGSGRLFDFLTRMGLVDSSVTWPGCTPVAFAERMGLFDGPCLLVHVNYVDDAEMKLLAESDATVVYCPRANDYFGRTGHRYAEMLDAGINVALGTEGLASSSSLDMFEEMRRLRVDARVHNQTILRMGTLHGAKALGWADRVGTLEPGKAADWIAVALPPDVGDPLEAILTGRGRVVEVAIAGKTVHSAAEQHRPRA